VTFGFSHVGKDSLKHCSFIASIIVGPPSAYNFNENMTHFK